MRTAGTFTLGPEGESTSSPMSILLGLVFEIRFATGASLGFFALCDPSIRS